MGRIPGDHQHPRLLAMTPDEVDRLVGHERAVVALGLYLPPGVRIKGERLVEMLVGIRPHMPVFEPLPPGTLGYEPSALVPRRQVPFSDIAGAIAAAPEG